MKLLFVSVAILALATTMASATNAVIEGNNKFGVNMFNILAKDDQNLLLSPFSAHVALSMAYQGADGETATALGKVLQVPSAEVTAEEYEKITKKLNAVKSVTLNIANKIFIKENFSLKPAFKDVIEKKFSAEAEEVNFADSAKAAKIVNTWVEKKTNDKIKDLLPEDSLNADTRLVIVNAVYFKGNWDKKFDKELTAKKPFHLLNGNEIQVDMMHNNGKYRYAENKDLDCKILELLYEKYELSMIIFLPNDKKGITQLQDKLRNVSLSEVTQQMYQYSVDVQIPKFKIESTIPMNDVLKTMGAEVIFSKDANFSKMAAQPLAVSDVIQKTFIEVNEEGAEAAAATGVLLEMRCMSVYLNEVSFHADHPFLVTLMSKDADYTALFLGRLVNPEQSH